MIGQPSTPVEREEIAPWKEVAFLGLSEKHTRVYEPHSQFPPKEGGHCIYSVCVYLYIARRF